MLAESVSRQGMPDEVPRTWILTSRDRALSAELQHKGIEASAVCRRSSRSTPVTA